MITHSDGSNMGKLNLRSIQRTYGGLLSFSDLKLSFFAIVLRGAPSVNVIQPQGLSFIPRCARND